MIISTDEEKSFDKIQPHFMIKAPRKRKLGVEGIYLNIIKAIYDKPVASIRLTGEKLKTIPPKLRNETRVPTLPTRFPHSRGIPNQSNKVRRRNKMNTNR
jgi:hypothetical protein